LGDDDGAEGVAGRGAGLDWGREVSRCVRRLGREMKCNEMRQDMSNHSVTITGAKYPLDLNEPLRKIQPNFTSPKFKTAHIHS
jgi:hypothetical protein